MAPQNDTASDVDVMAAERISLSRVRKAVARAMTASAAIPQFSIEREIDARAMVEMRARLPKVISIADLFNTAIARSLVKHARLNASWQEDHILEFENVNIGVAVAVPDGLLVPAINRAQALTLTEMAVCRRALTQAALSGRLKPQDLGSATISVSNVGTTGATGILPMVIPPQATIIGLPGIRPDGTISVNVTCDHRVVDGYPAALFLATLAEAVEKPKWLESIVG